MSGALDASRLHIRFQPIVAIADRRPVAMEVLARLDHPALGLLFPDQFIPQIEDAGLVRRLTESVVDCALVEFSRHLSGLPVAMTMNVPLDVLMLDGTAAWLGARCAAAGLAAGRVIVELTESQPVAALGAAGKRRLHAAMDRLRALDFRLAIDDFGPDMPRRQDLFDLPFAFVKLDKAVVVDPAGQHVVEQAVRQSRDHGLCVVAEGVEDDATWQRMQALGVAYVQGFLVSRPLPASGVGTWLAEWRVPAGTM